MLRWCHMETSKDDLMFRHWFSYRLTAWCQGPGCPPCNNSQLSLAASLTDMDSSCAIAIIMYRLFSPLDHHDSAFVTFSISGAENLDEWMLCRATVPIFPRL